MARRRTLDMGPSLALPTRSPGRQSTAAQARYEAELHAWCEALIQLDSRQESKISSRGWCYLLEPYGLDKGDFDKAQKLINDCRKDGHLPLDFTADDDARAFETYEDVGASKPSVEAAGWVRAVLTAHTRYTPWSFWRDQTWYVQLVVEKIDIKNLFRSTCARFRIPTANARGWADINMRADMMRRFAEAEARGQLPVLLYCGDFDPAGLLISDTLRKQLEDLSAAVGWDPCDLTIDRFGLTRAFIDQHNLTWIKGLKTGSGGDLADPRHPDRWKTYVQDYIAEHGARKVEANVLVTIPEVARQLLLDTITKYLAADAPEVWEVAVADPRGEFERVLRQQLLKVLR